MATGAGARSPDMLRWILAFYALLALIGGAWMALRGDPLATRLLARPDALALAVASALALALVVDQVNARLLARAAWSRTLRREVRQSFAPLGVRRAWVIALASASGEEILFRGAMQPALGLLPTALLFGLLHGGLSRALWCWAIFACVMGLALGLLFERSGGLLAPILAHALINGLALVRIAREPPDQPSHEAPHEAPPVQGTPLLG